MDPVKILKRAWHILWSYRALWVFGLILALTAAGSSGGSGNNGARFSSDGNNNQSYEAPLPENWREEIGKAFAEFGKAVEMVLQEGLPALGITKGELTALIWISAAFILVMLVVGIVMAIARYVSETAVIRMVDEYEATDTKMTVRQGFRIGWSRTSWRLFLINLVVNLPVILLLGLLVVVGFIIYRMVVGGNETFAVAGIVSLIGVVFLAIFVVVILSILLRLLRQFFWRVCALEDVGVGESLRRGFAMVRENWKNVGLMWLIMIGLGIVWIPVSVIAAILTILVVLITIVIAAVVAAIPGLLLVGFFSLFLNGYLPWIAAGIFIMPLFFTLAFSPWVLLTAWQQIYTSTVWTLTYREIKALPAQLPVTEIGPVGD
ncbi:MAG: hypothetical protein JW963_22215 [Anaerolineales bacterium]|nr:hypothetical protein [Anaerolineales bacterium]